MKARYTITQMIDLLTGPGDVDAIDVVRTLGDANGTIGRLETENASLRQMLAQQEASNEKVRDILAGEIREVNELKRRFRLVDDAASWMTAKLREKFEEDRMSPTEIVQWQIARQKIRAAKKGDAK